MNLFTKCDILVHSRCVEVDRDTKKSVYIHKKMRFWRERIFQFDWDSQACIALHDNLNRAFCKGTWSIEMLQTSQPLAFYCMVSSNIEN